AGVRKHALRFLRLVSVGALLPSRMFQAPHPSFAKRTKRPRRTRPLATRLRITRYSARPAHSPARIGSDNGPAPGLGVASGSGNNEADNRRRSVFLRLPVLRDAGGVVGDLPLVLDGDPNVARLTQRHRAVRWSGRRLDGAP